MIFNDIVLLLEKYRTILFLLVSIIVGYVDIISYTIPRITISLGILVFVFLNLYMDWMEYLKIIGLVLGSALFVIFIRIVKKNGIGFGDIYVSIFMMSFVNDIYLWYFSFLGGTVLGILYFLGRRIERIPFAPFLLGSTFVIYMTRDFFESFFIKNIIEIFE